MPASCGGTRWRCTPYLGYHVGDYLQRWLDTGTRTDDSTLPKIFSVNWFRRDDTGRVYWPELSENSRMLRWIVEGLHGATTAVETPVRGVPAPTALDPDGLDVSPEDVRAALTVDVYELRAELPLIEKWFATIGDRLPTPLLDELKALRHRLA